MSFAADYWERRYAEGGTSGAGSRGPEADLKAALVQTIVNKYRIRSILDLGCGDGYVADAIRVERYVGYDVSETALALCRERMPDREWVSELPREDFDMTLSMDVIFHLVDERDFAAYMGTLLALGRKFALVYGTDAPYKGKEAPHVRHRHWTDSIPPGWSVEEIPTRFKRAWLLRRRA